MRRWPLSFPAVVGARRADNPKTAEFQINILCLCWADPGYRQRTLKNVQDSDGTLILFTASRTGGTKLTRDPLSQGEESISCGGCRTGFSSERNRRCEVVHNGEEYPSIECRRTARKRLGRRA